MTPESRKKAVFLAAGFLWLGGVLWGMERLYQYKSVPGRGAQASSRWPAATAVVPAGDVPTLVMFAHPRCPCTTASLTEFNLVMNRAKGSVAGRILFYKPAEEPDAWVQTASWKRAQEIPGTTVLTDPNGREARRFGAFTSGQVLLYDKAGRLVYSGGVTASRGHEGLNEGRQQILTFLTTGRVPAPTGPVFGCALFADEKAAQGDRL